MSYHGPFPNVEIPDQPLHDYVFEHALSFRDKAALIDAATGRSLTYGELIETTRKVAKGLIARGMRKGDVCAIYSPNVVEYAPVFYGIVMTGAVVTTVNPHYTATELRHQLRDSGARLLVTTSGLFPIAKEGALQSGVEDILVIGEARGATPLRALIENDGNPPAADISPRDDLAVLPYSSGTTGLPKGVMLTHYNLVANVQQTDAVERLSSTEVLIGTLPFYHIYGMSVLLLYGLRVGATIVMLAPFRVKTFLSSIQNYKVTTAYLVPPLVRTLAMHRLVGVHDLSSLKDVVSAAAPLPEPIARACAERLHCTVRQVYGMTEASPNVHVLPRTQIRLNSVGLPLPNTESRVVEVGRRRDVSPGELGEVWVRGPQVMKGYLNNPEATRTMIDREGWLHTGDIGYTDKDGFLYVVDRAKELVKFRGLHYGEHELLLSMVEDIAARRQAERRIRLQAMLLDSVRESVVATDRQRRVTFWNRGAEALFGYAADEALGRPIGTLIIPANDPHSSLPTLERDGRWQGQVVRRRRDGSHIWTHLVASTIADAEGHPSGSIAIHRDITEQKAVEQRLRFQAQLLDSVRESVIAADLTGKILYWSKGAETLFGYRSEEVLGQSLGNIIDPGKADMLDELVRIREAIESGMWNVQQSRRRKDGSTFYADVAVAPVRDSGGETVGIIAIHRDVTELKKNQEMLRDSREELRRLASSLMQVRENERSALARELHDELGQALTRLKIDVCWLQERLPRYLQTKRAISMAPYVDTILESVQRLSARLRPAILDDLGLDAAIEWLAGVFADWNGCRCRLALKIGGLSPDHDRDTAVFRIVQEALTNVARHAHAKHVTVRGRIIRGDLVVEVEDDGVGLVPERMARSESLGLIGMRERAEAVGGELRVFPRSSKGTVVRVSVPVQRSGPR